MFAIDKNYNPLDRFEAWDENTQRLLTARRALEIGSSSGYNYLSKDDGAILQLICDILIVQPEGGEKIKIAEAIDRDLSGEKRGLAYADGYWPGELYRAGLANFKQEMTSRSTNASAAWSSAEVAVVIKTYMSAEEGGLSVFLRRVLSDAVRIFYSHPVSWSGLGFPGPAYPEGYAILSCDQKESWEPEYLKQ